MYKRFLLWLFVMSLFSIAPIRQSAQLFGNDESSNWIITLNNHLHTALFNCGGILELICSRNTSYLTNWLYLKLGALDTRGEEGALPRECHSFSWPWFWSELCQKSITNCWWTIPFNEVKWRWNNDEWCAKHCEIINKFCWIYFEF
jgi:hypothetical protein